MCIYVLIDVMINTVKAYEQLILKLILLSDF